MGVCDPLCTLLPLFPLLFHSLTSLFTIRCETQPENAVPPPSMVPPSTKGLPQPMGPCSSANLNAPLHCRPGSGVLPSGGPVPSNWGSTLPSWHRSTIKVIVCTKTKSMYVCACRWVGMCVCVCVCASVCVTRAQNWTVDKGYLTLSKNIFPKYVIFVFLSLATKEVLPGNNAIGRRKGWRVR